MDSNLQIKSNPGCKELLIRKLSYAITTSVLSQIVILSVFLFVVNFSLLHPLEWLGLTWSTLTSISTWIFVIPFLSVIFAQSIICAKDYVLKSACGSSRIEKIISTFSLRNMVLLDLHIFSGGLFTWLYISLVGGKYGSILIPCKTDHQCLNMNSLYLVLCGLWSGFYFFVRIYRTEKRILFPVVQQPKLLHFKSNLLTLVRYSQKAAFWPVMYFVVLYFLWGGIIQNYVSDVLNVEISDESFSYITILFSWLYSTIYIFIMNLMRFFFELYLTEPINFPIVNANKDDLTLSHALCINNIPIIQHLASFDLFDLSRNSIEKRKILFTLSQPGNHPHNWNNLVTNTLKIISGYTDTINSSVNAILNPEPASKVEVPLINAQPPVLTPHFHNMRNLGIQNLEVPLNVINVTHNRSLPFSSPIQSYLDMLIAKINALISTVKARFGINYLFRRLPLKDIQCCLEGGQIIIWVTQAMSNLTIASLKEDNFGVVQKDLPIILSTLVELKHCIEKLNRIPTFTRKTNTKDDFNIKMKSGINAAIKRSLYNICKHFGPYINDIPLKKEVLQYLQPYIIEN